MKLRNFLFTASLLTLIHFGTAIAEEQTSEAGRTIYAGILAGANNSTSTVADSSSAIGATVGYKFSESFGVGVMGTYYGQTSMGTFLGLPAGTSAKTILLVAQGNVYMGDFHLGLEAGAAMSSWSGNISTVTVGDSSDALVYGPQAGVDISLSPSLSIGGEAHYLFTNDNSGVNNVQLMASLKTWF